MISVKEAEKIILDNLLTAKIERIELTKAYGSVLAEDIIADRNSPPFHRVAMDGISIDYQVWKSGIRKFSIGGTQRAGEPPLTLKEKTECIEIMTGAILPIGANCVIKVEDITLEDNFAIISEETVPEYMLNIHQEGSDCKKGTILVKAGQRLTSPEIAVSASVGNSSPLIKKNFSIAIISTGDELVNIDQEVLPHQIRMSNSYALQGSLNLLGFQNTKIFHLKDNKDEIYSSLKDILDKFDILILSGGVSMGKFDYIPEVLKELNVTKLFHKIRQRPGKPFWFGLSTNNTPVFALPGNPVSTIVCFHRYIVPFLLKSLGIKDYQEEHVILKEDFTFKKSLVYFLPVKISNESGNLMALPKPTNGSGDYSSLVNTDGFIELSAEKDNFKKGEVLPFFKWVK